MAVTLEGYRIQVIEQLKVARGAARARDLLAEVNTVLASAPLSRAVQGEFWASLNNDLDILTEELKGVLRKEAAGALEVVLTAAQGAVLEYQRRLQSDAGKSTD